VTRPGQRNRYESAYLPPNHRGIDLEERATSHFAQVVLQCREPVFAQRDGPADAQVIEYGGGACEDIVPNVGASHQLAPSVSGVSGAVEVAEAFKLLDVLGGGLLGDAQASSARQLRHRTPASPLTCPTRSIGSTSTKVLT
jgi:hypothetical protein